jgi:hypothetical protein
MVDEQKYQINKDKVHIHDCFTKFQSQKHR